MKRILTFTLITLLEPCVLFIEDAWAHAGWGIVLDRQGQIYFVDVLRNRIWRIDNKGRLTTFATNKHSHQLILDSAGNLYYEHVYYDSTGKAQISFWNTTPDGVTTTADGHGIGGAMDPSGNIYLTNCDVRLQRASQILKRTPQGQVSVLAGSDWGYADGKNDGARFSLMGEAMAWGSDGSLYVTDGPTVRKVTLDGQVSTLAIGLAVESADKDPHRGTLYNHLMGLTVDPSGNVYVADFGNRRVVKIRPDGKVATMARSGRLWSPVGVAFAASELYVLEHLATAPPYLAPAFLPLIGYIRVRKISSDGTMTTIATVHWWIVRALVSAVLAIAALVLFAWRRRWRRLRLKRQEIFNESDFGFF